MRGMAAPACATGVATPSMLPARLVRPVVRQVCDYRSSGNPGPACTCVKKLRRKLGDHAADSADICVPVQPGGKIDKRVLVSRGRHREVGPNLRVKEVVLGEGERRERYAVCYNAQEARRRRRHRAEVLAKFETKLAALSSPGGSGHSKQVELRSSGRYRRYLRLTRGGSSGSTGAA